MTLYRPTGRSGRNFLALGVAAGYSWAATAARTREVYAQVLAGR